MANIKVCGICGAEVRKHLFTTGWQPIAPRYELHEIGHLNKSKVIDLCAECEKSMVAWIKAKTESEDE